MTTQNQNTLPLADDVAARLPLLVQTLCEMTGQKVEQELLDRAAEAEMLEDIVEENALAGVGWEVLETYEEDPVVCAIRATLLLRSENVSLFLYFDILEDGYNIHLGKMKLPDGTGENNEMQEVDLLVCGCSSGYSSHIGNFEPMAFEEMSLPEMYCLRQILPAILELLETEEGYDIFPAWGATVMAYRDLNHILQADIPVGAQFYDCFGGKEPSPYLMTADETGLPN